ncbi:hypothetical protein [Roseateles saccharophilus]|uniref:Uncharacterized protein n=1 Tax=Roseateles saccharophilus TaxID=304 RepID=A0A4R3VKJ4_ROSSA|nr:hypothetical protein [Roseateles saccharophilus]MDG0831304.1 hypothetical protein [Roseateles saccharophilus]TCV04432.1 hypothetical protein EV671_1001187 [Roseateles saccharophilus]
MPIHPDCAGTSDLILVAGRCVPRQLVTSLLVFWLIGVAALVLMVWFIARREKRLRQRRDRRRKETQRRRRARP